MNAATMKSVVPVPGQQRVLVIDDHPEIAHIACVLLSVLGYDCRTALSGRAGLDEAARFEPDIVILDLSLPDLSGFDVARELRARAAGRPMHIAALTGWNHREERQRALAGGFDQYVVKPIDYERLQALVAAAAA